MFIFSPWGNPLLGESIGNMLHVFKVPKANPGVATVFPMLGHGDDGDVLDSNDLYIYTIIMIIMIVIILIMIL